MALISIVIVIPFFFASCAIFRASLNQLPSRCRIRHPVREGSFSEYPVRCTPLSCTMVRRASASTITKLYAVTPPFTVCTLVQSTPTACSCSTANSPKWSSPMAEVNSARMPSFARVASASDHSSCWIAQCIPSHLVQESSLQSTEDLLLFALDQLPYPPIPPLSPKKVLTSTHLQLDHGLSIFVRITLLRKSGA